MTDKAKLYAVKNDEGEWLGCEIYCDEPDWFDHGGLIWDTRSIAEENVKLYGGHVVELVEKPGKVVVSEEEAEMLELANAEGTVSPTRIIMDFVASKGTPHSWALEDRLMRAYVNGWEAEKPKLWNVKVPHTKDVWYYKADKVYLQTICPAADKKLRGKFTEAEINHYGLQDCERVEVTDDDD